MTMDHRRECDGQPPSCAPNTTPHFFKIILNDTSRDTKLRLPYKFVKKYGGELSHSVCLKVPGGSEWEVDIMRQDCKVWFEKGWPEFSNSCSLDHGHFLVFGYEGNSKFDVCIFDRTATEIDYPITVEDDDLSGEILEDCPRGSRNSGDKSPLPGSPPCKKNRKSSTGKPEINPKIQMDDDDDDDENDESDEGSEEGEDEDNHGIRKKIAFQRAKAYKPADPHFVVAINPSCNRGGYMHVPSLFSKTYLVKQPTQIMLQTVSNEEPWYVDMHYHRSSSRLRTGWLGFVRSNNLLVGDACVFVLKDNNEFLFDVVFYRAT
ncbi:B3 domain-containing transcription factor VRN1 [Rosa sericea]